MAVIHRPMEPKDVRECAGIVAQHPIIGPRYGRLIGDLPKAWLRLLDCEAKRAIVFQESDAPDAPICFVGVSVFVTDDFVHELKTRPCFWFGPELVKRILGGRSPILSDRQLARANSNGGLNVVVWEGCVRPRFENINEVFRQVMKSFIQEHAGLCLKEAISSQLESAERLRFTIQTGGMLWNPVLGRYVASLRKDPNDIVRKPHLVGITRQMEVERPDVLASWVGGLFEYRPPRCGFSCSQQRMLLIALDGGGTDRELAHELGVSVPTIKKMWLSVYRRAAEHLPNLGPNHRLSEAPMSQRGTEKKRYLLAYLRKHPEELRPAVPAAADARPRRVPIHA